MPPPKSSAAQSNRITAGRIERMAFLLTACSPCSYIGCWRYVKAERPGHDWRHINRWAGAGSKAALPAPQRLLNAAAPLTTRPLGSPAKCAGRPELQRFERCERWALT